MAGGVIEVDFLEDASATIMCRIEGRPTAPGSRGSALASTDFTTISYTVVDITTTSASTVVAGHSGVALTPGTVISSGLQPWHVDAIGHNFRHTVKATTANQEPFPTGGNTYQVEVKWTHTDGSIGYTRWTGDAQSVYGS